MKDKIITSVEIRRELRLNEDNIISFKEELNKLEYLENQVSLKNFQDKNLKNCYFDEISEFCNFGIVPPKDFYKSSRKKKNKKYHLKKRGKNGKL